MKRRHLSPFTTALTAFVAINMAMSFFAPIRFDPFKFPYRGWAWWTFDGLRKAADSNQEHNVALLGSSLMVSAVTCCDANYLKKGLDLTEYHGAEYLDNALQKTFGGSFKTYNLSAPGQMPSDAFLTLEAMLATANRPDVVIYGVAPRDFIDSSLSNPTDTEPFRFLSRLVNTDNCAGGLFRDPLGKLQWSIDRNVYLAHHSLDIQLAGANLDNRLMDKILPVPYPAKAYTYWERNHLLPRYKAGEIYPNAISTHPTTPKEAAEQFRDNTAEYIERYARPDERTYNTQFYFLRKLAQLCKKERIELVVVNMPITQQNIKILRPELYLTYIMALRQFAQGQGLNHTCWDLNDFNVYDKTDYHDFVHLNAYGGAKFFDHLTAKLAIETETRNALSLAGMVLNQKERFAAQPAIDVDKVTQDLIKLLGPIQAKTKHPLRLALPATGARDDLGPLM
jgi:hypothetical protein